MYDQIDHINRDKLDDRFCNLREATASQNACNRAVMVDNALGVKGVDFLPKRRRYRAHIRVKETKKFLGFYRTVEEAKAAYDQAAIIYHGEFART